MMDEGYDRHVEAVQHLKAAVSLFEEGVYSKCGVELVKCLELDESLGDAWELYGLVALAGMQLSEARYGFERAEESRGQFIDADLALRAMRDPTWPQGEELLDSINGLVALGQVFLSNARWRAAALCFTTAEPYLEPNYRIGSILGLIYRELGLLEVSLQYYEQASSMDGAPPGLLHDKAIVLIKLGRFEEAERLLRYLLDAVEDDPQLWNNYGAVIEAQGRDDDALEAYERSLEHDPEYYPALYSKGRILQKKGLMDEARPILEKALDIEGRVYDLKDVLGSKERSGDGEVHLKEISRKKRDQTH
ncbi:MAG: tetratricopeptide repeat protein [Thermoplasmatota archaeon]